MLLFFCFLDTFILQGCAAISDTVGAINVSCASSHKILVTVLGYFQSSDLFNVFFAGDSPIYITGLQPGGVYNVTINVYSNGQVVLMDWIVQLQNIIVMDEG